MSHPIYGPPKHDLEVVTAKLRLPSKKNGLTTTLQVQGDAQTSRKSLWTYAEVWRIDQVDGMAQPVDMLSWVMLAVAQDRPVTQASMQRCLLPGGFTDTPLPF